jgi:hypothetical protein
LKKHQSGMEIGYESPDAESRETGLAKFGIIPKFPKAGFDMVERSRVCSLRTPVCVAT